MIGGLDCNSTEDKAKIATLAAKIMQCGKGWDGKGWNRPIGFWGEDFDYADEWFEEYTKVRLSGE